MKTNLTYNGVSFGQRSKIEVSESMQYDDADRTVVHTVFKIRASGVVGKDSAYGVGQPAPGANQTSLAIAQHMQQLRGLLEKPGCILILAHDSFGPELRVNESTVRDIKFGPKPRVVSWVPIGHESACEVVWECEVCLPYGWTYNDARFNGLSAFNYSVNYSIDLAGWTTRTINGYLTIANNRQSPIFTSQGYRKIADTADRYRDIIKIDKPANFERESDFTVSPDKCRLDFTIVDSEIKSLNVYPPGVVSIRARHRTGWTRREVAYLPNTITCSIELARNQPKTYAWEIFKAIVSARVRSMPSASGSRSDNGYTYFLEGLEVSEELFEHKVEFSISYRIMSQISELFKATDILNALQWDHKEWRYWNDSMKSIQSNRGTTGLAHSVNQDAIIDLFMNGNLPYYENDSDVSGPAAEDRTGLYNEKPRPERSWLRFEANLEYVENRYDNVHITMGEDDLKYKEFDPKDPNATAPKQVAGVERFIESTAPDMLYVWRGYAERVGYDIPIPDKIKVGGVTLVKVGKAQVRRKRLGLFFGQPVYAAAWVQTYRVTSVPEPSSDEADPVNTQQTLQT